MCILAYNNYPQKQPKRKRDYGQKWRKVRLKTDPPADVNH